MIRYSDVSAITQLSNTFEELFCAFFISFLLGVEGAKTDFGAISPVNEK
jgi:hypothetical protein